MTINQYIQQNNILPGDAIVVRKNNIGLLDHYLIYLGWYYGEHKFIANYFGGTKILTYGEVYNFSLAYRPSRIRRFKGNNIQRKAAVERALSRKDQNSYHLILNNCEHYANYVQEGKDYSQQTTLFGAGIAVSGLALTASSKNNIGKGIGAAITFAGLLAIALNDNR